MIYRLNKLIKTGGQPPKTAWKVTTDNIENYLSFFEHLRETRKRTGTRMLDKQSSKIRHGARPFISIALEDTHRIQKADLCVLEPNYMDFMLWDLKKQFYEKDWGDYPTSSADLEFIRKKDIWLGRRVIRSGEYARGKQEKGVDSQAEGLRILEDKIEKIDLGQRTRLKWDKILADSERYNEEPGEFNTSDVNYPPKIMEYWTANQETKMRLLNDPVEGPFLQYLIKQYGSEYPS